MRFHIKTCGAGVPEIESPVLEVCIAAAIMAS